MNIGVEIMLSVDCYIRKSWFVDNSHKNDHCSWLVFLLFQVLSTDIPRIVVSNYFGVVL